MLYHCYQISDHPNINQPDHWLASQVPELVLLQRSVPFCLFESSVFSGFERLVKRVSMSVNAERAARFLTHTLHGTAIYADQLTPSQPPQLIGSPMAVPWSVWVMSSFVTF